MSMGRRVLHWLLPAALWAAPGPWNASPPPFAGEVPLLASVKRICVDKIVGEEPAVAAVRELAIAGLFGAKRFTVTEKCDKADAILKGAVLERGEKRVRAEGEAAEFGAAAGGASVGRTGGSAGFGAIAGGSGESLFSAETRSSASVVMRLVDHDGTVIWAHTQDSPGGKVKGAISDAVDRAVKQLIRDVERSLRKPDPGESK